MSTLRPHKIPTSPARDVTPARTPYAYYPSERERVLNTSVSDVKKFAYIINQSE